MKPIKHIDKANKHTQNPKKRMYELEQIKGSTGRYRKKLRVLALSDVHSDITSVRVLAERAEKENVDIVLVCGDFTTFGERYKNMIGPFLKKGKKVMFIPGNHEGDDLADFISEVYKIKNLHGHYAVYEGIGFFGAGGANVGPNMKTEREIMEALEQGFERVKHLEKTVMVTHIHPAGSKMESFSKFVPGSESVAEAVKKFKPDILVCGHAHEATGIEEVIGETKVLNVARDGKVFEI